jgi:hypothetical protein
MRLPPALQPWGPALSTLDEGVLVALGPLLRGLDTMIARHATTGEQGDILDGYSGITSRGTPERILTSEWALAEEVPLEFLRRAAGSELLYTAPAYRTDQKRGRVVVLADTGPDQTGAGRLVQLAALIVLHRRATARGADLVLGILGSRNWQDGDLAKMLPAWLKARRSTESTPEDVHAWTGRVPAGDELWLLIGPRLARRLPGQPHLLVSTESGWNADGATSVRVTLAEVTMELPLPDRKTAVRTLRGAAFRSSAEELRFPPGMRSPLFAGSGPQLITRGRTDDQLHSVYVPYQPKPNAKVHNHQLPGPVVAAAHLSGRLVALVLVGDELRAHVIGKKLGGLNRLAVPLAEIDHTATVQEGLVPLYFNSGRLLVELSGRWWQLTPDKPPVEAVNIAAVGPGKDFDRPTVAWRGPVKITIDGRERKATRDAHVMFGPNDMWAWSTDETAWTVHSRDHADRRITVERGCRVLAVHWLNSQPALVTVSPAGHILRAHTEQRTETLTKWSQSGGVPAIHPTRPFIAVQRGPAAVDVCDLGTGGVLLSLRGGS